MLVSATSIKYISIVLTTATLAACAPMAVKDIAVDKPGYLAKNFSQAQLPTDVSKQIATNRQASPNFHTIKIKFKSALENNIGEKKTTETADVTYKNVGNGLVQILREYANNDIPFSNAYELSYLGLFQLRSQQVINNQRTGNFIVEVKHLNRFEKDFVPVREDATYAFEWASGNSVQIANFTDRKMTCSSGKFYPAAKLYDTLPGNAIDLNCEFIMNGSVYLKQKLTFLQQYGVAMFMGFTNNAGKGVSTITSVEVQ